jgi:Leucine-rich repeat (LRR) protein
VTEEELKAVIEKARVDRSLKLDLRHNQLRSLPTSIGDITTLIELDLSLLAYQKVLVILLT